MPRSKAAPAPFQGDTPPLMRRLSKAKTSLILESPFVGTIALNMPFLLSDEVPTAATNGKRVLFNPSFIADMTDEELKFLVAHEVFHPMMDHNFRRGERNPRKWNRACDYVINQLLTQEGIGKMPSGGLLNAQIYQAGGGTSDGIYNILEDETGDDGGGYADGNGPFDDCEDAEGSNAEQAQAQAEMKIKVAQAAQAAKMMGKLSANMQRLVDEVLQPKVDWRDVLQRFAQKARTDQRTYARPNRIFAAQGLYLPSISGEVMGEFAFAVDCSGSVTPQDINQAAAEVTYVFEQLGPVKLHVIYFDSTVSHADTYTAGDTLDIKPHGGGGTAFSPVFRYMEEHDMNPVACVFLTDLYCNDFGPEPDYPVLWVSTGADRAPFGEVVMMA
jgi:predicted metal-dependent peptidase